MVQAEKKEMYQLSEEAAEGGERFSPGKWEAGGQEETALTELPQQFRKYKIPS